MEETDTAAAYTSWITWIFVMLWFFLDPRLQVLSPFPSPPQSSPLSPSLPLSSSHFPFFSLSVLSLRSKPQIPKGIKRSRLILPLSAIAEGKTMFSLFFFYLQSFVGWGCRERQVMRDREGQFESSGLAERPQRHLPLLRHPKKAWGSGWRRDALGTGSGIWDLNSAAWIQPKHCCRCQEALDPRRVPGWVLGLENRVENISNLQLQNSTSESRFWGFFPI